MLSVQVENTNFVILNLIRPGLKHIIYHTRGEQTR